MKYDLCRVLLVTTLLAFASGNSALGQHMNAKDAPCKDAGSNRDTGACFVEETARADQKLNATYAVILKFLDEGEKNKLRIAQRLWVQFRDANCDAEYALYGGGTGGPVTEAACRAAMTKQRVTELQTMFGWRVEKFGGRLP